MTFRAFIDNTNLVTISHWTDVRDDAFLNDGIGTFFVEDAKTGQLVPLPTDDDWPRPMSYVAGSNGNYVGILPDEAVMTHNREYNAVVTLTSPSKGLKSTWRIVFTAKVNVVTE